MNIYLNNNQLDLFEDTHISFSWTAFRFQTAIKDMYSNDFDLPKTEHNIKCLGIYSLFDTKEIQFSKKLLPATIDFNGNVMPIYLQVVGLDEKTIKVTVFEDKLLYTLKNKKLSDFFKDSPSSIYEYNKDSVALYPNVFLPYNYGAPYKKEYAQYHPSYKLNTILTKIMADNNMTIESIDDNYRLLASERYVCPQNTIQVAEFNALDTTLENNLFTCFGGQHIVNDLSSNGVQEITFNRDCYTSMRIWFAWDKKGTTSQNKEILVKVNNTTFRVLTLLSGGNDMWGFGIVDFAYNFKKDDKLSFQCKDTDKFRSVSLVVRMQHSAYTITDDDYKIQMSYPQSRRPRLVIDRRTYVGIPNIIYVPFDGDYHEGISTERLSFCYFGYYTNIPDVSIGEILYSLQWIYGGKIKQNDDHIYFDKKVNKTIDIPGELQNMAFSDDVVGQKNYIRFKDQENPTPISTIDNTWLEPEKNLHVNCFKYIANDYIIHQYESENYEEDGKMKTRYNLIDFPEPVLLRYVSGNATAPFLFTYRLGDLTQSKSCEFLMFNTPSDINDIDFVIINGREFFVIDGEKDMNNDISKIHCMFINK